MMRRLLFPILLLLATAAGHAEEVQVKSPNGQLIVTVGAEDGHAYYSATLNGKPMLLRSALGFVSNIGDFSQQLTLQSSQATPVREEYQMSRTKASTAVYDAWLLTVAFKNADDNIMFVEFSVADHDVAFRYLLTRQANDNPKSAIIYEETTSFRFPDHTTTFISPQSTPMIGWERTKPSYEEVYSADAPMSATSQYRQGFVFPALFHIGADGWALVSETGVTSQYCGAHLSDFSALSGYTIAYPQAGENNGNGTTSAGIPVPGYTPWRTITLGETLKPIVETTVQYDLVNELYQPDAAGYKPGRYTWSWLIWQDESINYDDQVKFIDLAAALGLEYCLVDNWWDARIGRERMAELSRYAQSKGVSLMLWYNSNGYENDAPQTPRQCMNTSIARDREMAWLKSIGVKGIKVDFFGGDKQVTMQLYEDILSDANRYGLQVIFHGCTLPRGWERMYPNYVASEAVLASENVFFDEQAAIREPFDLTLHPFCRNASASMDWGGIILNKYLSPDNRSRHTRKTTDIFELASGITMQTAVQCVAIQPNNLDELPAFELDFLRQLPTTWDETRFIDGYPGRYVVLARRHGDQWFVAGLNAERKAKKLTLDLPMLSNETLRYYYDAADGTPLLGRATVSKKGKVSVEMRPNGGFILTP